MPDDWCARVVPADLIAALAAEAPDPNPPGATTPPPASGGAYTSRLLVDRWLADRGVGFRVKPDPDGRGRTVYVLATCPFDPSHADPDACVMQAPDGKLSAQCFHNGCAGKGWQQFKEKIGRPQAHHYDPPLARSGGRKPTSADPRPPSGPADPTDGPGGPPAAGDPGRADAGDRLPTIRGNKRQLRDVTADGLRAILGRNNPPVVFVRGRLLTRLKDRSADDPPVLEPLTDDALRGVLARVADWTQIRNTQRGEVEEPAPPPMNAVKDLATLPDWPGVPALTAVVETPVFARDGTLVDTPGYCPAARLWYSPAPDLAVPAVPIAPTPADVDRARHLIVTELFGDFPFADDASRAHAVAALLLPFVRPMIDGPTPLHLLDAPVEGTGKTLLASAVSVVSTGRDVEAIAEARDDEEWRKRITAVLAEGPAIVLLDNINRVLDAGALAAALTARVWKDRILGVSKTARLPVTCAWLASGNNTRLSRELIRRTLFCRLDAKTDAPWLRDEFRHPDLLAWAKANRGDLVWAALTLVRAWLAAGRPPGTARLGMYESWVATIGGILRVAGVPGLLANAKEFRAARADQVGEWRAFVAAWWARFAGREVGVRDLFRLATELSLLDSVLGDQGERSQRTRLGLALARSVDRVFDVYRLSAAGEDHAGRQQYALQPVASPPPPPTGPETGRDARAGDPPSAPDGPAAWLDDEPADDPIGWPD
jgi:putative DNA primase/helicase